MVANNIGKNSIFFSEIANYRNNILVILVTITYKMKKIVSYTI